MTNEQLIWELVDAAYDSGYHSGKNEDGLPHHEAAIVLREKLRKRVVDRMNALTKALEMILAAVGNDPALQEQLVVAHFGVEMPFAKAIIFARAVLAEGGKE